MNRRYFILLFVAIALLGSVAAFFLIRHDNPLKVNLRSVDYELEIKRFDQALFDTSGTSLDVHVKTLQKDYPVFFDMFCLQIIRISAEGDKDFYDFFHAFLTDYTVTKAFQAADTVFENMDAFTKVLEGGLKHYAYYFPEKEQPEVITFISGFNHSIVTDAGILGIGLDKYLGGDHELYELLEIPHYARRNMTPRQIPVDAMWAYANMEFPFEDSTGYMIYSMIHHGKIMYFLDAMYPGMPDSVKMGYSAKDIAYCRNFEKEMWTYLVEEEILFETNYLEIRKFTGDAPFTAAFGKTSPGRSGIWLGWQIVRSYMRHNNLSLPELMLDTDYQKILNKSKYLP